MGGYCVGEVDRPQLYLRSGQTYPELVPETLVGAQSLAFCHESTSFNHTRRKYCCNEMRVAEGKFLKEKTLFKQ